MSDQPTGTIKGDPFIVRCPECGRVFDLLNERDAAERAYGHDCEPLDREAPKAADR